MTLVCEIFMGHFPFSRFKTKKTKVAFSLNNFLPKVIKKKKVDFSFRLPHWSKLKSLLALRDWCHTLSQVVRYGIKSTLC